MEGGVCGVKHKQKQQKVPAQGGFDAVPVLSLWLLILPCFEVWSSGVCINDQGAELRMEFPWHKGKGVGRNVAREYLRAVWHV